MEIPAGDADKGLALFKMRCTQCHTTAKDAPNKMGPNLYGLFGRTSGSLPNYKYTDAMRDSGIVWREDTLFEYLYNPKRKVPKTKMAFPGFKSEKDRADLIAYLRVATATTSSDQVVPARPQEPSKLLPIVICIAIVFIALMATKKHE